jgi:hypothetical protein
MTPSSVWWRRPSGRHRLSQRMRQRRVLRRSSRSGAGQRSSSRRPRRARRSSSPRQWRSGPPTRRPRCRRHQPTGGTLTGGSLAVSPIRTTAFSSAGLCAAKSRYPRHDGGDRRCRRQSL